MHSTPLDFYERVYRFLETDLWINLKSPFDQVAKRFRENRVLLNVSIWTENNIERVDYNATARKIGGAEKVSLKAFRASNYLTTCKIDIQGIFHSCNRSWNDLDIRKIVDVCNQCPLIRLKLHENGFPVWKRLKALGLRSPNAITDLGRDLNISQFWKSSLFDCNLRSIRVQYYEAEWLSSDYCFLINNFLQAPARELYLSNVGYYKFTRSLVKTWMEFQEEVECSDKVIVVHVDTMFLRFFKDIPCCEVQCENDRLISVKITSGMRRKSLICSLSNNTLNESFIWFR
ncbi:hypothetical protein L596_021574 [Steinernema carpocapsae]|uniref:Uncharacterized protein n=1 Tax=Steinernema carpocapsae TaxID=34508 RepID=A0A4U5MJ55_STECR|nr:hypothetical protein L596_021574 [Steinernema carpocapsae]